MVIDSGRIATVNVAPTESLKFSITCIISTQISISQITLTIILNEPDVSIMRPVEHSFEAHGQGGAGRLVGKDIATAGIGIELSCDYFRDGVGYLQTAELQRGEPTLFDFIEQEGA